MGMGGNIPTTTPGIVPGPGQPAGAPQGFYNKLLGTLFGGGPNGADPAAQNRAMIQLGLGMMAGSRNPMGFGAGALGAYTGALDNYQGAMQRAYENNRQQQKDAQEQQRYETGLKREDAAIAREQQAQKDAYAQRLELQRLDQEASMARAKLQASVAIRGMADDAARAELAKAEQARKAKQDELVLPLQEKIAAGKATPDDLVTYQVLTGGRADANQTMLYGGGMGAGMGQPGGNPLLNDQRLNTW